MGNSGNRGGRGLLFPMIALGVGVSAAILVSELGLRAYQGDLARVENYITGDIIEGMWSPDPTFGLLPTPNLVWQHPSLGTRYSFNEISVRQNGNDLSASPVWALAVGDSFTFGAQVNDNETWPAALERLMGKRVVNGGGDGFGLDQAVLRAIQLHEIYHPEVVILSFIPHDVVPRCEMSNAFNSPKPYFELEGDGLRLVLPVVKERPRPTWVHKVLGYSLLVHELMNRYASEYWHCSVGGQKTEHNNGREVGCRLMAKVAAEAIGPKTIVLAQHRPDPTQADLELSRFILACAEANHLETVDSYPALERLTPAEREPLFMKLPDPHMSPEGNLLIATELKRFFDSSAR